MMFGRGRSGKAMRTDYFEALLLYDSCTCYRPVENRSALSPLLLSTLVDWVHASLYFSTTAVLLFYLVSMVPLL